MMDQEDPFEDFEEILRQQGGGQGAVSQINRDGRPRTALSSSTTRARERINSSSRAQVSKQSSKMVDQVILGPAQGIGEGGQAGGVQALADKELGLETLSEVSEELSVEWHEEESASAGKRLPKEDPHKSLPSSRSSSSSSSSQSEQVRAMVNLVSDLESSSSVANAEAGEEEEEDDDGDELQVPERSRNSATLSARFEANEPSRKRQVVVDKNERYHASVGGGEPNAPPDYGHDETAASPETERRRRVGEDRDIQGANKTVNSLATAAATAAAEESSAESLRHRFDLLGDNLIVKLERRFSTLIDSILANASSLPTASQASQSGGLGGSSSKDGRARGRRGGRRGRFAVETDWRSDKVESDDEMASERRSRSDGSDRDKLPAAPINSHGDCRLKSTNSINNNRRAKVVDASERTIYEDSESDECLRVKIAQSEPQQQQQQQLQRRRRPPPRRRHLDESEAEVGVDADLVYAKQRGAFRAGSWQLEDERAEEVLSGGLPEPSRTTASGGEQLETGNSFEALQSYYRHRLAKLNRIILINSASPLAEPLELAGGQPALSAAAALDKSQPIISARLSLQSGRGRVDLLKSRARSLLSDVRLASERLASRQRSCFLLASGFGVDQQVVSAAAAS